MFTIGTIVVNYDNCLYGEVYHHDLLKDTVRIKVLYYKEVMHVVGDILTFDNCFTEATEKDIKTLNKLLVFK